jgi:DNA-binding NtrC family response regulator
MSELKRILVVDDEENCLRVIKDFFDLESLGCLTTNSAAKALELVTHHEIDIAQWVNDSDTTGPIDVDGTCTFYNDIRARQGI